MTEEKTFFHYEDVSVTNSRFMVGSQTFAMSNITSVQALKQNPKRFWPTVVIVLGGLYSLGSFTGNETGNGVIGLVIVAAGVVWWLSKKPMFHVMKTGNR